MNDARRPGQNCSRLDGFPPVRGEAARLADTPTPTTGGAARRSGSRGCRDRRSRRHRRARKPRAGRNANHVPAAPRCRRAARRLSPAPRAADHRPCLEAARLPPRWRLGCGWWHRQAGDCLGFKMQPLAPVPALRAHRTAPPGAPLQRADEELEGAAPHPPDSLGRVHLAECHTGQPGRIPAADLQTVCQDGARFPVDQRPLGHGRGAAERARRLESAP